MCLRNVDPNVNLETGVPGLDVLSGESEFARGEPGEAKPQTEMRSVPPAIRPLDSGLVRRLQRGTSALSKRTLFREGFQEGAKRKEQPN